MTYDIAAHIEHTLLKPDATTADIQQLCKEAIQHKFAGVCVPPYYVTTAREAIAHHHVNVVTVAGFPFGYNVSGVKLLETITALEHGADEVDVVHNIAALKKGDWKLLSQEAETCAVMAHNTGRKLKLILETGLLTDEEIIQCCEVYGKLPVDFLKTSTGYAHTGATVHAVSLLRKHLPKHIGIKASGGIRTFAQAKEMLAAGANRLGCSAGVSIMNESKR